MDMPASSPSLTLSRADAGPRPTAAVRSCQPATSVLDVPGDQWDALAARFDDVVQEQLQSFYDDRIPRDAFRRLAVYRGDDLIGAALARRMPSPVPGLVVHQVQGGPMWRLAGRTPDFGVVPELYRALAGELTLAGGGMLLMLPRAEPDDACDYNGVFARLGFRVVDRPVSPERYFVNVSIPADEVRKSFNQKTRAHIKKSEQAGLTAGFEDTVEGFDTFYALYREMVARKGLMDYNPVMAIRHRMAADTPLPRPRILVVRKDGVPVAAAVIDRLGDRATYLYGASSEAALPLKAGFFMQWKIIEYLCGEPRLLWYDLIGANSRDSSLHQFKRGLVGKKGRIGEEATWHWIAGGPVTRCVAPLALKARDARRAVRVFLDTLRGPGRPG